MAHLVRGGSSLVERRPGRSIGAERQIVDDHSVRVGRTAGELCVSQQTAVEGANPKVEMGRRVEWRDTARRGLLYAVVVTEAVLRRLSARDLHQLEADARIGDQPLP